MNEALLIDLHDRCRKFGWCGECTSIQCSDSRCRSSITATHGHSTGLL